MAKAKKKTTKRKSTTTKKKTSTQKQTDWLHSEVFQVCLFLCFIALSIIAIFKFGVIGSFIFNIFALLVGNFTYALLLLFVCIFAYKSFNLEGRLLRPRYCFGILAFIFAWLLLQSVLEFSPQEAWYGLSYVTRHTPEILRGEYITLGGMVGALLLGIICSMIDYIGCYLCIVLFVIIGALLFWYEYIATVASQQKKAIAKASAIKKEEFIQARNERKAQRQMRVEQDEDLGFTIHDSNDSIFVDYDPNKEVGSKKQKSSTFIDWDPKPMSKKEKVNPTYNIKEVDDNVLVVESLQEKQLIKKEKSKPVKQVTQKTAQESKEVKPEENTRSKTYVMTGEESFANYKVPSLRDVNQMLERSQRKNRSGTNVENAREQGQNLIEILRQFDVNAKLVDVHIGPSVTKFEIKPEIGVRISKISNLQNDIKMALAATDIRIEAPIPGKNAVGIEIPNAEKTTVQMRELIDTIPENKKSNPLLFCLGKDLTGTPIYGEMNKMPHLLIAGATGSGKSVCVNSIISSILLRSRPDEVKLVLVDPKKVEFTPYNDVPHLLAPVITDAEMANKALKVVVQMMDKRYDLFGEIGVRNIQAYNEYLKKHQNEENNHLKPLPWLVVIIDELADLMLVAAKEVEGSIQRITQLARAAGIHLIVATQRPSVDVITGVIKANIPSRIAFAVSSAVDSRTILDQVGAEKLLGYGDMLYLPNGETAPKRVQGVFIKDEEVNRIADYAKNQAKPRYDDAFITLKDIASQGGEVSSDFGDPLYEDVKRFVIQSRRASTSLIQRKFSVGYSRAARLIDALEENGVIGPANGSKPREILFQNTLENLDSYE